MPVQNEVAYEYFGDRFSVTAERTYKQVYTATLVQTVVTASVHMHLIAHLSLINRTSESHELCVAPVFALVS